MCDTGYRMQPSTREMVQPDNLCKRMCDKVVLFQLKG